MCGECCCGSICNESEYRHRKRFLTKEEKVEKLKIYSEELKKELIAVEENIQELSK